MFRIVKANFSSSTLKQFCSIKNIVYTFPSKRLLVGRSFGTNQDKVRETINNLKEKFEEKAAKENEKDQTETNINSKAKEEESQQQDQKQNANASHEDEPQIDRLGKVIDVTKSTAEWFVNNVKLAYQEMIGESKKEILKKKVHQAESFKVKKPESETENEGEENVDKGMLLISIMMYENYLTNIF